MLDAQNGANITKTILYPTPNGAAKALMDDAGVPGEDRTMVISARAVEQALKETKIGSSDYNVIQALAQGTLTSFAGFKFVMMESRLEGGLAVSSNVRTNFAYHKSSIGLATGAEMMTSVDWVPTKTSWLINAYISAGAVTIDSDGVYAVNTYEA
jgi:hypothetical protein